MTQGERVKNIRKDLGYTLDKFGERLGVRKSAMSKIEKGENNLTEQMAKAICREFRVNYTWLTSGKGEMFLNSDDDFRERIDAVMTGENSFRKNLFKFMLELNDDDMDALNRLMLQAIGYAEKLKKNGSLENTENTPGDLAGDIHNTSMRIINYYYRLASAGPGQIVFDTPPTERIEIPDIPKYRKVDYAIGVNGNSMEPMYHDGDILLVEMRDEIEVGEIGIFLVDGNSFVKKLGKEELISLNPKAINVALTEESKCMGKVIDKL
ncbi:XRE family transcriptional regulator [Roseburia sp. 1XD42-69]|uniref:XRE family transcriptional regulator n=1 Tax=Roseburia sp. 1XD42-69 TaxID=2320088 RepID=UPI001313EAB3|nr:XRE family transcriptional regulator [Roseburia sp. 1XD42-69]